MKNQNNRAKQKITLNHETLRLLSLPTLSAVNGGLPVTTGAITACVTFCYQN